MKAKIHLLGDLLIADLDDGKRLEHADAVELAEMLWAHGVTSGEITAVDWHTGAIHAPLGGQKIAIYSLLRSRKKSSPPKQSHILTEDQLAKLIVTVHENDSHLRALNAQSPQKKS